MSKSGQDKPLGLANAALTSTEFLGDDEFAMFLGGNLIEGDQMVEDFHRKRPAAQLLLRKVPDPDRFGFADLAEGGSIRRLSEKPKDPSCDLALVGDYLFTSSILVAARHAGLSWRGELGITDAIQLPIDDGQTVRASRAESWWLNTGKSDEMVEAKCGNRGVMHRILTWQARCESHVVDLRASAPSMSCAPGGWRRPVEVPPP